MRRGLILSIYLYSALEAAVAACANDPLAGPLWDMYIQLETFHVRFCNSPSRRIFLDSLTLVGFFYRTTCFD
jgi:hypothetical protein